MNQIIEGLDNEVVLGLFFFTTVLAFFIPLYIWRPSRQENRSSANSDTTQSSEDRVESNVTNDTDIHKQQNDQYSPQNNQTNADADISNQATINIKIKCNETTQEHTVDSCILIKDLKQKCFPEEFAAGKTIRIIYAGRFLTDQNNETLNSYKIEDGCVIHCVISDRVAEDRPSPQQEETVADLDLSASFIYIYGFIVVGLWVLVFFYTELFSNLSISILGILTCLGFSIQFLG